MVHPLDLVAHHGWHIAVREVACLEDLKKTSLSDRSVPDYDQLLHLQLVGHLCLQERLCSDCKFSSVIKSNILCLEDKLICKIYFIFQIQKF